MSLVIPTTRIVSRNDPNKTLFNIRHFIDGPPTLSSDGKPCFVPRAYKTLLAFMPGLYDRIFAGDVATVIFDSMNLIEAAARKWDEYELHLGHKEPRSHHAESTRMVEELLYITVPQLPVNVILLTHIAQGKERQSINGEQVLLPAAPGRLCREKPIGGQYQEVYRIYVAGRDTAGNDVRLTQTRSNGEYACGTMCQAPDGCPPTWKDWFKNDVYLEEPKHIILMGQFNSGKSTAAGTCPKPAEVIMFDGLGKDRPYRDRGVVWKPEVAKEAA